MDVGVKMHKEVSSERGQSMIRRPEGRSTVNSLLWENNILLAKKGDDKTKGKLAIFKFTIVSDFQFTAH